MDGVTFVLLAYIVLNTSRIANKLDPVSSWSGRTIFDPPKLPLSRREVARRWGVVAWMVVLFGVVPAVCIHYRGG